MLKICLRHFRKSQQLYNSPVYQDTYRYRVRAERWLAWCSKMQDRMANASLGAAVLAASASRHPGLFWSMRKACSLNSLTMVLVLADGLTVKLCSFESGYKAWDWPFPCLTALYLPNRGGQNLTITLNTQREYMPFYNGFVHHSANK